MTVQIRQGEPGAVYDWLNRDNVNIHMEADEGGLLRPGTPDEVALCDAFGLAPIQDVIAPAARGRSARRGTPDPDHAGAPAQED